MSNKFELLITAVDKATKPIENIGKSINKLNRPIAALNRESFNMGASLGKTFSGIEQVTQSLGVSSPLIKMMGAGAGIMGIGAMIEQMLSGLGRYGTNVSRISGRTGISTRNIQMLQGAGRRSGVSSELVDSGLGSLGGVLEDSLYNRGQGIQTSQLLKTLGIDISKTASGAPDTAKAFMDIAEAISQIANPEVQNAVARQLNLESLLPMLTKGKKGITDLAEAAERAGEVMSKDAVAGAEKFDRSLDALKSNIDRIGRSISGQLVGPIDSLVQLTNKAVEPSAPSKPYAPRNGAANHVQGTEWIDWFINARGNRGSKGGLIGPPTPFGLPPHNRPDQASRPLPGGASTPSASVSIPHGGEYQVSGVPADMLQGSSFSKADRLMILEAERQKPENAPYRAELDREIALVGKGGSADNKALAAAIVEALHQNPIPIKSSGQSAPGASVAHSLPVGIP